MITFVTGDLLDAKVDALVNTVNTVGVMGKGLALQFKKAFPANFKAYEAGCKRGEVETGKMFVFDAGRIVPPRYIINFPTKQHWRSPSTLEYVEYGLAALIEVIRHREIRSIAVPPLGAGLGLDWKTWLEVERDYRAALTGDGEANLDHHRRLVTFLYSSGKCRSTNDEAGRTAARRATDVHRARRIRRAGPSVFTHRAPAPLDGD